MKILIAKLVVVAMAILLFGACGESEVLLSVAAGSTGGTWHPIGGMIGNIINRHVPGVRASVETTGGGVENVRLVGTGESDIGLCIAATALNGYRGTEPYSQAFPNLRTLIGSFQLGYLQMAVLEASELQTIQDIKGRRVALGPAGHGSIPRQREIYGEMGVSFDDFTPIYLPYRDALQSLGDRRIDAAVLYMAPPAPSLIEFGVTNAFRLLPIEPQYSQQVAEKYPYFVPTSIAKKAYGFSEDVPTIATANVIMVGEEVPEETVYQIIKALVEHIEELRSAHPSMQEFQPEMAVVGQVLPYHPGAERYFRETGLLK